MIKKHKIVHFDMDGVLADWSGSIEFAGLDPQNESLKMKRKIWKEQDRPYFWERLKPLDMGMKLLNETIKDGHDVYFLSTAPWACPNSFRGKRIWLETVLETYLMALGTTFSSKDRLILTKRKDLLRGEFLIDDRVHLKETSGFWGELVQFNGQTATSEEVLKIKNKINGK